jgi:hypothetical protein
MVRHQCLPSLSDADLHQIRLVGLLARHPLVDCRLRESLHLLTVGASQSGMRLAIP